MSVENLDKIFQPKSIAVVGASERKGSVGAALMRNLIERGFSGEIHPINPNHKKIGELAACPSIKDLEAPVDLAIICTPITSAPQIVKDCVDVGVGGAVIISAGGKEIGEQGKKLEAGILKEAGHSGLRIIGPNCVGIMSARSKLNASFANQMPIPGKMAFISQSGAICTAILDLSIKENIGFSYFVRLGDMLDVDFGDMIDYLGGESDVSSIVMYVESLTNFRKFMSAARAVSRVKPIIVLKAGRTPAGALAAASHTGAMAGEDSVYDAAFQRAGILRVKTFEELFDCAELLAKQPKLAGPGLAIITNAGGPGVMATDALSDFGYEPVSLSTETFQKLDEILPPYWSKRNPIDMLGEAKPELYRKVVEICLNSKEVNGLLIISAPQALADTAEVAAALVDLIREKPIPIITSWVGGSDMQTGRDIFNQAGIPTFDTPERAVRAFMDIYRFSQNIEMLQQIPSRFPKDLKFDRKKAKDLIQAGLDTENRLLREMEAKELLSAYGIPVDRMESAVNREEAVNKAEAMGFPVVLKINSRDITHKSDAKGVFLDLKNEKEVRSAFDRILKNAQDYNPKAGIDGVTIQPMRKRPVYELILGAKQDRDFGPVILFGMGGILTEVLKDRAIALPPLNRLLAKRLMEETKVYQLLQGYRDIPPANIQLLEEILIRLAQLVTDFTEIEELDINPLFVNEKNACAIDARVLLKPSQTPAPLHLVISPYPDQFEERTQTNTRIDIFVRPIRPEDAPLLVELFESLSPQSVYRRFFTTMKRLPHSMLARFTQIDYDRHIALVALSVSKSKESMLGVARVILERNQKEAEFSVVVSDPWQGKGIGAALLQRCLNIAKERGIEKVMGTVLAENTQMLALGKKLGFKIKKVPGVGEYELSIGIEKEGVFTIRKSMSAMTELREKVHKSKRVAIIGGGFIGAEFADELSHGFKTDVHLIEIMPKMLVTAFDDEICDEVATVLGSKGIHTHCGNRVASIDGNSQVESVTLENRRKIKADMVLVSIGAKPANDLAQKAGLRLVENGSIWVDEYMRTDAEDVFAVGDCAVKRDFFTRKAAPVWLAFTATAEARNAGTNIYGIRVLHQIQGTISAFSTKIGEVSFASAGMTCRACQKEGFRYVTATAVAPDRHPGMLPGASQLKVKLVFADRSGIILGGQVSGGPSAGELINMIALAIQKKVTVRELDMLQIATHPLLTSAPTVHPMINAAHQALAKLRVAIRELPSLKKVA